ncbi:hypothetical protein K3152_00280 [Qipengyuania sp. 1NDH17]|uniref:Sel1 repeat family protein n=1 Tax=Qipengyuania polymorpha TaxID=2867234 RepID=A0ABS7IWC6_9SPHN|nr:hypothetical protein [Qipengyuania polymorpha]MBX7456672.1 hypothetical protein [Qipengyuania polymorpha]
MRRCILCRKHDQHLEHISYDWEIDHSNYREIWQAESPEALKLIARADALGEAGAGDAIELLQEAAECGSIIAHYKLGWHHWTGTGTKENLPAALEHYRSAFAGGLSMASLHFARLSNIMGQSEEAERVYLRGVDAGFLPANYWLAEHRYNLLPTRKTAALIRPLLEPAARAEHPHARILEARLHLLGKYGLRSIFRGIQLTLETYRDLAPTSEQLERYS